MSSSYKPGKLWIDYLMNTVEGTGNSWNSGVEDPRASKLIPKIVEGDNAGQYSYGVDLTKVDSEPQASDVNYVGLRSTDDNVLFYTQQNSPYFLFSYSEAKFIEAEVLRQIWIKWIYQPMKVQYFWLAQLLPKLLVS
jgi:hypothetical protein